MNKLSLLAVAAFLSACSTTSTSPAGSGGRTETGQPALHAIHDQELHELMAKMDALMQERFMTETEIDNERRKFSIRIADNAQGLVRTVDAIIGKMPGLPLTQGEQSTFLALAHKLGQQAELLSKLANNNRIDEIDDAIHQINTTCVSCHALFRKTGG